MKSFFLFLLLIIFIINCACENTQKIRNKVCNYNNAINCNYQGGLNKYNCENSGCCYYYSGFFFWYTEKCYRPSCIYGCKKCNDLYTCEKCEESFYKTEDTNKCHNTIIDNYYLDDKILRKCHENCSKCSSSSVNIQSEIYDSIQIDMKCDKCKNGYYFLEGTNNCYDYFFSNEGYYLKDNDKFYPCDPNCSTCSDKKNDESNNCLTCDNSQNLYLVEGLNNCVSGEYSGYYLNNIQKKYIKCYFSCKECNWSYEPMSNKHNCIQCIDNYYKLGESNCYNDSNAIDGYYLDKDEEPPIWKECYERCQTCNTSGNFTNMNCLSCRSDLIDPIKSKPYKLTLTTRANCVEGCSNGLYLTLEGDCVTNCSFGFYKYSFNHTCLSECPHNYEPNSEQTKCIIKSIDQETSSDEFKSQVPENILEFVNSTSLYNGSNFLAVVLSFSDTDPKEQVKKGISAVDLGDCEFKLKDYYNISYNESLIILNMESKRNETKNEEKNDNSFNVGKTSQVEVFDFSGRKLNLSICNDIRILKYIGDVQEELNLASAANLANQGIDVFNPNDSFFNDLCHNFDNGEGKDIVLTDRRNELFQNVSFCQEGCIYNGIDYEYFYANCICDSNSLQEDKNDENDNKEQSEDLTFKSITKSFIENLLDFNIDVIYCYNLVFDLKRLIKNYGFYCMLIMLLIQIIYVLLKMVMRYLLLKYHLLI